MERLIGGVAHEIKNKVNDFRSREDRATRLGASAREFLDRLREV